MESNRNIICAGSLYQQPLSGTFEGLLLRLKNLSYGTHLVLCLHNKIPILEWYRNTKKVNAHEPNALQDLIDGKAVAIDYNTFAIFFDNEFDAREPLKFMAENQRQRDNWISKINQVRIEHNSLLASNESPELIPNDDVSNEYCSFAPTSSSQNLPNTSELQQKVSSPINCFYNSLSPGLQPTAKSFSSITSTSFQHRESGIGLSTSNSDESNFRLSKELNLSVASSPSFSTISSPLSQQSQSRARSSTMTHFKFDDPPNNNNKAALVHQNSAKENQGPGSPAIKRVSTRKSSFLNTPVSGLSSPKPLNVTKPNSETKVPTTTVTPCESNKEDVNENGLYTDGYYHCKNEGGDGYYRVPTSPNGNSSIEPKVQSNGPQKISLAISMSICTDLKIVRMMNRFWIVGWDIKCHKAVNKLLHFGDEILEVNGNSVASVCDLNTLFYASPVGLPIQLLIRSIPYGEVKTLKKSIRISQKVGIVLREGTNKIESVEPGTLAGNAKLSTEIPSFANPNQNIMPSITEINNKPLNPFSEETYSRISEIANGQLFDIILHPSDFVRLLKAEMRTSGYI